MHSSDDMDLESMLNNPYRNLDHLEKEEKAAPRAELPQTDDPVKSDKPAQSKPAQPISLIERNHPLELRMLSLEKNEFNTSRKIDDIKTIIEHQNERIQLLEEEFAILRNELRKMGE